MLNSLLPPPESVDRQPGCVCVRAPCLMACLEAMASCLWVMMYGRGSRASESERTSDYSMIFALFTHPARDFCVWCVCFVRCTVYIPGIYLVCMRFRHIFVSIFTPTDHYYY